MLYFQKISEQSNQLSSHLVLHIHSLGIISSPDVHMPERLFLYKVAGLDLQLY